jgi:hypothetical protein
MVELTQVLLLLGMSYELVWKNVRAYMIVATFGALILTRNITLDLKNTLAYLEREKGCILLAPWLLMR